MHLANISPSFRLWRLEKSPRLILSSIWLSSLAFSCPPLVGWWGSYVPDAAGLRYGRTLRRLSLP